MSIRWNRIERELSGIVKGNRHNVSRGVKEMNSRVKQSHYASPWYGNTLGNPCSQAYLDHFGYSDLEDDLDYVEDLIEE